VRKKNQSLLDGRNGLKPDYAVFLHKLGKFFTPEICDQSRNYLDMFHYLIKKYPTIKDCGKNEIERVADQLEDYQPPKRGSTLRAWAQWKKENDCH